MKKEIKKEIEKDIHLKELAIKYYRNDSKRIAKDYKDRIDYNNSEIKRLQKEIAKLAKKIEPCISKNGKKLK